MTRKPRPSRFLSPDYHPPQAKGPRPPRLPQASRLLDPGYRSTSSPFDYQLDDPVYILGLIQQSELLIQQLQLHLDHLYQAQRRSSPPATAPATTTTTTNQ